MQPRRIGMLAPFGIRPKGTLAVRMLPLAQTLVRRGHCVTITAPPVHNPQDAGCHDVYDGVMVTHVPLPALPGAAGTAEYALRLFWQVKSNQPDLLHLFKPRGYSGLAALLARLVAPHLPLVVDSDDWEGWGGWNDVSPYPRSAKALFAWQERDLPRRAHAVTVASRTLQTQVWGAGVPPSRVFYLPNGIRVQAGTEQAARRTGAGTGAGSGAKVVLLYTRFWEFDVPDMVAALVAMVQGCPDMRLRVVGAGERGEERDLLRLAERAGVAGALDMHGWVEPATIPALLASADVAIVPMNDTLINRARCSVKLLELMAAGLPIVAGRVGQVAEYIEDGHSGVLVAPGAPAPLAQETLRLLHDPQRAAQLGAGARARAVQDYAWDTLATQAEQAYALAMEHKVKEGKNRTNA